MKNRHLLKQTLDVISAEEGPAPKAFVRTCRAWLACPNNRDGRGTKSKILKETCRASRSFRQALSAIRNHDDATIRHKARRTVTAALHQGFPDMHRRLRELNRRMKRVNRRSADKLRQAEERTIRLNHHFELHELRSVSSLQRVGRSLRNCTSKKRIARRYCKRFEMWVLREREQRSPLYLLAVNRATRETEEFEGENNSPPPLKRNLALQIINALEISGDEEEAFAKVGAFQAFAERRGSQTTVEPIQIGGCRYWIWVLCSGGDTEIIIATKSPGANKCWSRFSDGDTECLNHPIRRRLRRRRTGFAGGAWNHLSEGDLIGLMLEHPAIAEELRSRTSKARPDSGDPSDPKAVHIL